MGLVIGLTGGIACGKSTVSRWLVDRGLRCVDADRVARQVVEPGSAGLRAVLEHFGPAFASPDGGLDRKALGALVFSDEQARRQLEAIVHPLILAEIDAQLSAAGADAAVVDAALLLEMSLDARCDRVVVVRCEPAVQLARLMERDGLTAAQANARISAQMADKERARRADRVIDNSGDRGSLETQLHELWGWIQSLR